jgi:hypothetical protein
MGEALAGRQHGVDQSHGERRRSINLGIQQQHLGGPLIAGEAR